jgi:hypothetical protein
MNGGIFEPETEVASGAPVARGHRILRFAVRAVVRAFDPDMEVVVVAVHGAHLVEPRTIAPGFATECLLD